MMIDFKHILCPIDFSDISNHAFLTAQNLAERFGSDMHVIHVFQLPASSFPEGVYSAPDDEEARIKHQLSNRLNEFVKSNSTSNVNITTGLYEGIPHIEIIRSANENNADLIVMGSHGRTGLTHALIGSVAERVIRTSSIPVFSVRK